MHRYLADIDLSQKFAPAKTYTTIGDVVNHFLPWVTLIAGLIFTGLIIYVGFLFMESKGDVKQLNKSRDIMIGAVAGIILIISAFVIVAMISGILGANQATKFFK